MSRHVCSGHAAPDTAPALANCTVYLVDSRYQLTDVGVFIDGGPVDWWYYVKSDDVVGIYLLKNPLLF